MLLRSDASLRKSKECALFASVSLSLARLPANADAVILICDATENLNDRTEPRSAARVLQFRDYGYGFGITELGLPPYPSRLHSCTHVAQLRSDKAESITYSNAL
jgi:hypothetical protein